MSDTRECPVAPHPQSVPPQDLAGVVVIIPALNEEQSISLVLRDLPAVGRVIVVDNGSTDRTVPIASELGALVVAETERGYGAACLRGLEAVRQLADSGEVPVEIVVFLDGDYSDYPDELPRLVAPILAREAHLVIGSRTVGTRERGALPPQSRFGNWLACTLMRWLFGARYSDLGPFRAIAYPALQQLEMSDRNFGWTIEMQIKAHRQHLRIREIPTPYRRRIGQSKISGTLWGSLCAGYKILWTIARYGIHRSAP